MFWKRYRKRLIWPALGIVAFLLFFRLFRIDLEIDTVKTVLAATAFFAVYVLYLLIEFWKAPKKQVTVVTKASLTSPPFLLKSVMTYKLKLESIHHIEERGKEKSVKMDELLLTFNDKDHPDIYQHCLRIMGQHADNFLDDAKEKYPNAHVVRGKSLLPEALKLK